MKEKIVNHGNLHDSINYKALIESQASNIEFVETSKTIIQEEKPKTKKLTKSYIRGKLNKKK